MPNVHSQKDFRHSGGAKKKLESALSDLEILAPPIIEKYNGIPEKLRPKLLDHNPILARLVKLMWLIK